MFLDRVALQEGAFPEATHAEHLGCLGWLGAFEAVDLAGLPWLVGVGVVQELEVGCLAKLDVVLVVILVA